MNEKLAKKINVLLQDAEECLETGDFMEASMTCETIIDLADDCLKAYLCLIAVENHWPTIDECKKRLDVVKSSKYYSTIKDLDDFPTFFQENAKDPAKEKELTIAKRLASKDDTDSLETAIEMLEELNGYGDSAVLLDSTRKKLESLKVTEPVEDKQEDLSFSIFEQEEPQAIESPHVEEPKSENKSSKGSSFSFFEDEDDSSTPVESGGFTIFSDDNENAYGGGAPVFTESYGTEQYSEPKSNFQDEPKAASEKKWSLWPFAKKEEEKKEAVEKPIGEHAKKEKSPLDKKVSKTVKHNTFMALGLNGLIIGPILLITCFGGYFDDLFGSSIFSNLTGVLLLCFIGVLAILFIVGLTKILKVGTTTLAVRNNHSVKAVITVSSVFYFLAIFGFFYTLFIFNN